LIMKGGVTSGVVYPPAVLVLAQKYRFRSIGGSSAGAIAAAAAAAAEYGRELGGFEKLQERSAWLGEDTNLLNLFQPSPETRPLMEMLFAVAEERKQNRGLIHSLVRLTPSILRYDRMNGAPKGALGSTVFSWLFARLTRGSLRGKGLIPMIFLVASGALTGGLAGGLRRFWHIATKTLPENFYGLCSGRTEDTPSSVAPALTDWLHATINDLAGRSSTDPPLTFQELSTKQITLKMITSNLSQSRPYQLPLRENTFLFHEDDMRRLFPEAVVEYMISHAHHTRRVPLAHLPGFHFLPPDDELPIVVATRMSLSFPLLLSAVRLYTVKTTAFRKTTLSRDDLQENWFSDGGISSNFPIHFFDAWLPERPTFGITLTTVPPEALKQSHGDTVVSGDYTSAISPDGGVDQSMAERKAVSLPRANVVLPQLWEPIKNVWQFLTAIFSTAQSYRDTTQSRLPSYRDRVVQVQLGEDEGGLNLAMTPETIAAVEAKGRQAGEALLQDFDFDHHRWVRFQVLMAELEAQLHDMKHVYDRGDYRHLVRSEPENKQNPFPYPRPRTWTREALRRLDELRSLVGQWDEEDQAWQRRHSGWGDQPFFAGKAPKPEPVLRVTPDL
jgi:predicted acylesterase/phospholipase RssA